MRAHLKHMPTKKDKILFQNELKFIKKMIGHLKECHKLELQKNENWSDNKGNN